MLICFETRTWLLHLHRFRLWGANFLSRHWMNVLRKKRRCWSKCTRITAPVEKISFKKPWSKHCLGTDKCLKSQPTHVLTSNNQLGDSDPWNLWSSNSNQAMVQFQGKWPWCTQYLDGYQNRVQNPPVGIQRCKGINSFFLHRGWTCRVLWAFRGEQLMAYN